MAQGIYINVASQNPAAAFVISELNPTPVEFYTIVLGDNNAFNIYLVDGAGSFSTISGTAGYAISFLIGRLGATAVVAQGTWTLTTSGWTASVDFNTVDLAALFGGAEQIEAYAQITFTGPDATVRTYGQSKIIVQNYIVTPGSGIPVPVVDYLTSVQTYAIFSTKVEEQGYTHTQNSPSSVWTVNHALGIRPTAVTIWVSDQVAFADIDYVTTEQLTVTFLANRTGIVRVR